MGRGDKRMSTKNISNLKLFKKIFNSTHKKLNRNRKLKKVISFQCHFHIHIPKRSSIGCGSEGPRIGFDYRYLINNE